MKTYRELLEELRTKMDSYEYFHITPDKKTASKIIKSGLKPYDGYSFLIKSSWNNERNIRLIKSDISGRGSKDAVVIGVKRGSGIKVELDPETYTSYKRLDPFSYMTKNKIDPKYLEIVETN